MKGMLSKAGALNCFEELLRDNNIGVDIIEHKGRYWAFYRFKRFHTKKCNKKECPQGTLFFRSITA